MLAWKKYADENGYTIYQNPDGQKNKGVQNGNSPVQYPDVVLVKSANNIADYIEEVETGSSVTDEEARSQWRDYSNLKAKGFGLVVPKGKGPAAERLATENRVAVNWIDEYFVADGAYRFQRYKG